MLVWEDSNGLGKGREINHISLQHCAILTACLTPLYQVSGYSAKWTASVTDRKVVYLTAADTSCLTVADTSVLSHSPSPASMKLLLLIIMYVSASTFTV